jgi:hypothetical protein
MSVITTGEGHSRSGSANLTWLLLIAGALGCSGLDPGADTCADSEECLSQSNLALQAVTGPPLYQRDPMRWGCLAPDFKPTLTPPAANAFNYTAILADFSKQVPLSPMQGAKMSFCLNQDDNCTDPPMAMAVPTALPGVFAFNMQIRAGALGFLRQEADGYITQDYYLFAPLNGDTQLRTGPTDAFTLVANASLPVFARDVGINVDPMLGIMALEIRDCTGARVEGAKLNLPDRATKTDLQSADYYATDDRLPAIDVPTDKDGVAGWVNVPTQGTVVVEAVLDGQSFGQTRLRVQANHITSGVIRPRYDNAL